MPGQFQEEQGRGLPPLQPEGAEEAPCPAAAAPGTNGARGTAAADTEAPPLRPPQRPARVPTRTYLGGTRRRSLAVGAGFVGLRRRQRDAARGGDGRRRAAARAATAEPGPLARVHRAGAAAQDGEAMLLRGTPGASLALLGKLPRPHDPP